MNTVACLSVCLSITRIDSQLMTYDHAVIVITDTRNGPTNNVTTRSVAICASHYCEWNA